MSAALCLKSSAVKGKRGGPCIQSSLKGYKEKRIFKGYHFLMESTRKRLLHLFSQKWYINGLWVHSRGSDSPYKTLLGTPCP